MDPVELKTIVDVMRGRWVASSPPPRALVADVSTDTRCLRGRPLYIALEGARFDGHDFVQEARRRGAVASVVAEERLADLPDRAGPFIAVDDPLRAMERLATWNRDRVAMKVIAVTGSVGKTSTKEFLGTLLRERFRVTVAPRSYNNRIGVATTLLAASAQTEVLVAELGTSAPGELSYLSRLVRPDVVILTEIAAAHLDGLRDLAGVVKAKAEVFDGLAPGGRVYLRHGITGFDTFRRRVRGEMRTFGMSGERGRGLNGSSRRNALAETSPDYAVTACQRVSLGDWRSGDGSRAYGYHFTINGRENYLLPVPGRHNVLNAVAAMCVASELGLTASELRAAVVFCRLPRLRFEVVEVKGVLFVNDCYNASPRSMEAAIEEWHGLPAAGRSFEGCRGRQGAGRSTAGDAPGGRVAVLGDMLELGAESRPMHHQIGHALAGGDLRLLVTVGEDSRWIQEGYRERGGEAEVRHFRRAEDCIAFLRAAVRRGDQVLIKGSRRIGLERVFKDVFRWVRLFGGRAAGGVDRVAGFRALPLAVGAVAQRT